MKLLTTTAACILSSLLASPLVAAMPQLQAGMSSFGFDTEYDNASGDLGTVACSDGPNGLVTKGYKTFGSLPSFPNVGAIPSIAGYNSASCGSCWQIHYNGTMIYVTGMDAGKGSYVASKAAMNTLTHNKATELGVVQVTATEVAASKCGL